MIDGAHPLCVAPDTCPRRREKFFDAPAIEDDGGTKMKTNGADSARILRSLLYKGVMVGYTPRGSLSFEKDD